MTELNVREESHDVSIAAPARFNTLPDTAYNLWVRDELADYLHLPNDGTRVEVIGGEIVVSPGPTVGHNGIVHDFERAMLAAELADSSFEWRFAHTTDLNLSEIQDGYIPDLIVVNAKLLDEAQEADAPHLFPHQVGLVMEVTSRSNAADDRQPTLRRSAATKWNGYAQVGIPLYLLVDRDPRTAQTRLYSNPDRSTGQYMHEVNWEFGQTIELPEPFGFKISTERWKPWK
jgi:Uma2 family endonuclease